MVKAVEMTDGTEMTFWDVDARIGPGSKGDDVWLVQFLLFRGSDGAAYAYPDEMDLGFSFQLQEVDGIWGRRTSEAMSSFEQFSLAHNLGIIADGVIDPMPTSGILFGARPYHYKLAVLQSFYMMHVVRGTDYPSDPAAQTAILMDMPNDDRCPADLSWALGQAQADLKLQHDVKVLYP